MLQIQIQTPHDCYGNIVDFNVHMVSDILLEHDLYTMLAYDCKAPDHSMLVATLLCSYDTVCEQPDRAGGGRQDDTTSTAGATRRYCVTAPPSDFMNNDEWQHELYELVARIEQCQHTKQEIDDVYNKLCTIILSEMVRCGQYKEVSNVTRKRHKPYKPYWNTNLSQLWKDMHEKEKMCRKYKGDRHRKLILKNKFVQAQQIFDKSLRSAERNYNRDTLENIEKLNVNDPNAFWAHIKRMGSRSRNIPLNFDKDGMTTTDIPTVLEN